VIRTRRQPPDSSAGPGHKLRRGPSCDPMRCCACLRLAGHGSRAGNTADGRRATRRGGGSGNLNTYFLASPECWQTRPINVPVCMHRLYSLEQCWQNRPPFAWQRRKQPFIAAEHDRAPQGLPSAPSLGGGGIFAGAVLFFGRGASSGRLAVLLRLFCLMQSPSSLRSYPLAQVLATHRPPRSISPLLEPRTLTDLLARRRRGGSGD